MARSINTHSFIVWPIHGTKMTAIHAVYALYYMRHTHLHTRSYLTSPRSKISLLTLINPITFPGTRCTPIAHTCTHNPPADPLPTLLALIAFPWYQISTFAAKCPYHPPLYKPQTSTNQASRICTHCRVHRGFKRETSAAIAMTILFDECLCGIPQICGEVLCTEVFDWVAGVIWVNEEYRGGTPWVRQDYGIWVEGVFRGDRV